MPDFVESCELCQGSGGRVVWQNEDCRVVQADEPDYPGFCRVILNRHAAEMSDLSARERDRLLAVVIAVERALRRLYRPDKINLASLGNVVPHVHWHVIARFADDRHFPRPIWAEPLRAASPARPSADDETLHEAIAQALSEPAG